jgi:hypothetical protein
MSVIRWESPDDQRATWRAVAEELREHPNEWAVVFEGGFSKASTLVSQIRLGAKGFIPKGHFEGKQRTAVDGTRKFVRVYARYIGEGGAR